MSIDPTMVTVLAGMILNGRKIRSVEVVGNVNMGMYYLSDP